MIKLSTILILLLAFAAPAQADTWTREDTTRQVIWTALQVVDWQQTRVIADNPDKYIEHNLILGTHPSRTAVDQYFLATTVGHAVISYMLPKRARKYWQYISIGVSAAYVNNNYRIGIRISN